MKLKVKATYGGYKTVAQDGGSIDPITGQLKPYQKYATPGIIPIEQMQGANQQSIAPNPATVNPDVQKTADYSGSVSTINNVANSAFDVYNTVRQVKGKLANGISNGIAGLAGLASIFTNAQLKREEDAKRIESLQGASYDNSNRGINNIPAYTKYGGNGKTNVEAEQGEVFDNNGDILKINDNAASHEEGGVDIQADRVLENTSTKRKDPMSKALRLDKDQVSLLSRFKAKRGMSHSDAYEFEAKENSKLQEKMLKAVVKVTTNKTADKYAIESGKLNVDLKL